MDSTDTFYFQYVFESYMDIYMQILQNRIREIVLHITLSHFETCMFSNVEINLSKTCLVSGLLSFEHPSVLLFEFTEKGTI